MKKNQPSKDELSYEAVAYPSFILPQTHPDRLAVAAKFCGMNPAPAEKCRVLELGCADGANLSWLASNLPESEFVGVELVQIHINAAEKNKADLELQNISFFQMDVLDITEKAFGKFDYIIAHGLFSWVPDFVREKILNIYDELLNPEGVGFISYNVYPGCHRRQIVRDIVHFHTQRFENPVEKVQQGFAFIEFLTENTANSPVYHELLKYERNSLAGRSIENIYHDELSEFNQPFYFTEFINEAEKHNLQFLAESEYFAPQKINLPKEVVEAFENISRNTIEYEQYADFFDCRRFRQTLLCKKNAALETEVSPGKVKEVYISSLLKPTSPEIDLNPDSSTQFISRIGIKMEIAHVLSKVILVSLVNAGLHPVQFADLVEEATRLLQSQGVNLEDLEKDVEITATILLQLYSPNAVRFHLAKSNAVDYISEKPLVSKFARWQTTRDNFMTNFHGDNLDVENDFFRLLLQLLDGTRTREDLIAELTSVVQANEGITEKEAFLARLPEMLNQNLFVLAKMGFLVG